MCSQPRSFRVLHQGKISKLLAHNTRMPMYITGRDPHGRSALWFACARGQQACAAALHEAGGSLEEQARISLRRYDAVEMATHNGHMNILHWVTSDTRYPYYPSDEVFTAAIKALGTETFIHDQEPSESKLLYVDLGIGIPRNPMLIAIATHQLHVVQALRPNKQSATMRRAMLEVACAYNNSIVVNYLFDNKLVTRKSPVVRAGMKQAVARGNVAMFASLNERNLFPSTVPSQKKYDEFLKLAVTKGHPDMLVYLLDMCHVTRFSGNEKLQALFFDCPALADTVSRADTDIAPQHDKVFAIVVERISETNVGFLNTTFQATGLTAFHLSCKHNQISSVETLFDTKLNGYETTRTTEGNVGLHLAAAAGHIAIVNKILERCPNMIEYANALGRTALFEAALHGKIVVVQRLVNLGAHVNAVCHNKRMSAHAAIQCDDPGGLACLEFILECSTLVLDHVDEYSQTLLHFAASLSSVDTVGFLLDRYTRQNVAAISMKDAKEETPLLLACKSTSCGVLNHMLRHLLYQPNVTKMVFQHLNRILSFFEVMKCTLKVTELRNYEGVRNILSCCTPRFPTTITADYHATDKRMGDAFSKATKICTQLPLYMTRFFYKTREAMDGLDIPPPLKHIIYEYAQCDVPDAIDRISLTIDQEQNTAFLRT
jgi:ankyrin repeat protein